MKELSVLVYVVVSSVMYGVVGYSLQIYAGITAPTFFALYGYVFCLFQFIVGLKLFPWINRPATVVNNIYVIGEGKVNENDR